MSSERVTKTDSVLKIGDQTVYFSSSEKMGEIPDNSIDIIITSPPYNRGKSYKGDAQREYDDNKTEAEYLAFLTRVWKECYQKASERAVFFLNIGDSAADQGISEKVVNAAQNVGWKRIQDIIWVKSIYGKGHYTPSGRNKRFNNIWEHIYLLVKNPKKYHLDPKAVGIPYADKSNIGRYGETDVRDPGNVFHIWYEETTGDTIKKGHDAPFPIGLPYQCIKSVPYCQSVLDPFLGTGTSLAAAHALGIPGFGYELFPQTQLIQRTISQQQDYTFPQVILIPHYEESIQILANYYSTANQSLPFPETKKAKRQYDILLDTLQKMGLDNLLTEDLKKMLEK